MVHSRCIPAQTCIEVRLAERDVSSNENTVHRQVSERDLLVSLVPSVAKDTHSETAISTQRQSEVIHLINKCTVFIESDDPAKAFHYWTVLSSSVDTFT